MLLTKEPKNQDRDHEQELTEALYNYGDAIARKSSMYDYHGVSS